MVHVAIVTESEGAIRTTQVSSKLVLISERRDRRDRDLHRSLGKGDTLTLTPKSI